MKNHDLNAYQNEKSTIKKIREKLEQFNKYYSNYLKKDIREREQASIQNLEIIPDLMDGIFTHLNTLIDVEEKELNGRVSQIVKDETTRINSDMTVQLPKVKQHLNLMY